MGARKPEVITGARGPASERNATAQAGPSVSIKSPALLAVPPGKVVFQASAAKYRLQLEPLEKQKGKQIIEVPRVVQFDSFLSKPYDEDKDAEIIRLVRESSVYEIDIWELGDLQRRAKEAHQEGVKQQLLADPEFKAAIIKALQEASGDDFEAPAASKRTKQATA